MKKLPLILFIYVVLTTLPVCKCFAQADTTVTFDFKAKKFINNGLKVLQTLKLGDKFQVRIININTNLYKVSINRTDTGTSAALAVPSFSGFSLSDLSSLVGSISAGGVSGVNSNIPAKVGAEGPQFQQHRTGRNKPVKPPKPATQNTAFLDTAMKNYAIALKTNLRNLQKLSKNCDELSDDYNALVVNAALESPTAGNSEYFNINGLTLDKLKDRFAGLKKQLEEIDDNISRATTTYHDSTWTHSDIIGKNPRLKSMDSTLMQSYKAFETAIGAAKDSLSASNTNKYILLIAALSNSTDRTYLSAQQQLSKDQSTLTLTFTPKSATSGLSYYSTNTYVFPLRLRSFWAVSSGMFISTLYNQSYSTLKTLKSTTSGTDTSYSILSEHPSKVEFGVNSMIKYCTQISENYTYWQFGAGPGVTITDKVRARLMIGTGLAFGESHTVVFDIGYIAGYTDQLSVVYQNNLNPPVAPTNITVSRLSSGGYFSIAYLFH